MTQPEATASLSADSPSTRPASSVRAPQILYLPDGGLVLNEQLGGQIRLSHLGNGQSLTLSGVFAERLVRHLETPDKEPFPGLGPQARQHAWLNQLRQTGQSNPPAASHILLANGLGMLFIELTDRCNERCIHCYADSAPERSARLSRQEIRRVLEQALSLGKPGVQFTGGDPLLHPELCFAAQTARDLGYQQLEIYTNGLALSGALLEQLIPYEPSFAFSVYSHDAAVHDAITQTPGSLGRTLKAMRRVQAAGLPIRVGMILMAGNRGMEDATFAFLQEELGLDADQFGIDVVRSTGRGEFTGGAQPEASSLQQFRHRSDAPQDEATAAGEQEETDSGRRGKLCVSSSGDVFPCIFSRRSRLGNIRRQSLNDILASLDRRPLSAASAERWQQCRESLSCSDCQAIAYLLQDTSCVIPVTQEDAHVAA